MNNNNLRRLMNNVDELKQAGFTQKACFAEKVLDCVLDILIEQGVEIKRLVKIIEGDAGHG